MNSAAKNSLRLFWLTLYVPVTIAAALLWGAASILEGLGELLDGMLEGMDELFLRMTGEHF